MFVVICAWCNREINCDPSGPDAVSHGICPDCLEEQLRELEVMDVDREDEQRTWHGWHLDDAAHAADEDAGDAVETNCPEYAQVGLVSEEVIV